MRDSLPASDPVWLVIDAVAQLDTCGLHAQRRTGGAGRAGYDPEMLLTLLIWAWAQGIRSSRVIERLCGRDVAFRIICAGDVPDHVTISRFRAEAATVMEQLFSQVLMLCARVGMAHLGVVALDSVKIGSDASLKANHTAEGLGRAAAEQAQIDAERRPRWRRRPWPSMRPLTLLKMSCMARAAVGMRCPRSWSMSGRAPRVSPKRWLSWRPIPPSRPSGRRSWRLFGVAVKTALPSQWGCRRPRSAWRS